MSRRKLARYRAKRNFTRTAEPSGSKARAPDTGVRRFVIQKHAARRLHYDLRLELGGVFRSWAVTKGPSLDPHTKRLAVEVEDHPLDYGDFEGTIPKGEYGGGTVQLWDRGFWAPLPGTDPRAALKAGQLKFLLEGSRLKGEWVLVRMKRDRAGGKRTNWLLIKHADRHARDDGDALLKKSRSVASGRTLAQIAAGKGRARDAVHAQRRSGARRPRRSERRLRAAARRRQRRAAAIRAAATRTPRRARAVRRRLGSRDQVRWLPHADARRRRPRDPADAQGPRLDRSLSGDRRGRAENCRTAWSTAKSSRWMRVACRASRRCRRRSWKRTRRDSCTSSSTCCTRTGRTCGHRASRPASDGSPSS